MSASWKEVNAHVLEEAGVTTLDGLVRVPYLHSDGTEFNAKLFGGSRSWWETPGRGLLPFGLETLPSRTFARFCALLVCEGESDTLAVREAYRERGDARALQYFAVGLPGASSWQEEWARRIDNFNVIYVVGDGDEPGRAMNWRVRRSLPWARLVRLPFGSDARSIVQHDPMGLDPFLDAADAEIVLHAAIGAETSLAGLEHALRVGEVTHDRLLAA